MRVNLQTINFFVLIICIVFLATCGNGDGGKKDGEDIIDVPGEEVTTDVEVIDQIPDIKEDEVGIEIEDENIEVPFDITDVVELEQEQGDVTFDDGGEMDYPSEIGPEDRCIRSGGTVGTGSCCLSVGDFPNTCLTGPCGCSPDNSHEVRICLCPDNMCFDGFVCRPM